MLQHFSVGGDGDGNEIRSKKDQAIYVGMLNPTNRVDAEKKEEKDKKGQSTAVMVSICAHVPMSLRARTSVPDDRSGICVIEKVWL